MAAFESEAPRQQDLDKCVHCGLCLNACPTYRELGLEMDSPRGRVYQMVQVAATGSAFILIHKSAFKRVEEQYGRSWYSPVFNEGAKSWISEDLSFCMRAAACEIPIHVHTGVKTTHYKSLWLDERIYDRLAAIEG